MTRQMHVSVFLLLLLFLFVQLCSTSGILAQQSTGVVRETPPKGQNGVQAYTVVTTHRKFIRIVPSFEDLTEGKYCTKANELIPDFTGENVSCTDYYVITEEMKAALKNTIVPAAIKLHSDRLLVDPVSGPLKVPEFDKESVCNNFTVPSEHHSKGVENADMVVYVAARPVSTFGVICAKNKEGRPIAGAINMLRPSYRSHRYGVRRAAHEIAHALGFDYDVFKEKNMVAESEFKDDKRKRMLVISNQTKKKVQEHYGCSTAEGMELQYTKEKNVSSHWNYRVAKDELMSSEVFYGAMYYTALTMSVFDYLPYYSANWGMEEPMKWGNNSGCDLLDNNNNYLLDKGHEVDKLFSKYPSMFCDMNGGPYYCTSDRNGLGNCEGFLVYHDSIGKEVSAPIYTPNFEAGASYGGTSLCNGKRIHGLVGSVFASDSMCLDTNEAFNGGSNIRLNGLCAHVSCDGDKVRVKYAGSEVWEDCPENTSITAKPSDLSTNITIKCPKYSEVCTIAPDGSSRRPLIVPRYKEPPQAPITPSTSKPAPSKSTPSKPASSKPVSVPEKGSHQNPTGTTGPERANSPTESVVSGRRRRDTTNAEASANENAVDSPTTVINPNKESLPSPQVPGGLDIRMSMDGTPAAACILHVVFLIMAVALVVPL